MHKDTKFGFGCLIAPPIAFVLTLGSWMLLSNVVGSTIPSEQAATAGRFVNVGFGLLGILSFLALPIGIVVGMVLLLRKKPETEKKNDLNVD